MLVLLVTMPMRVRMTASCCLGGSRSRVCQILKQLEMGQIQAMDVGGTPCVPACVAGWRLYWAAGGVAYCPGGVGSPCLTYWSSLICRLMPDGAMEHGGLEECVALARLQRDLLGEGYWLLTRDLGWTTRVEIRVSARPSTVIRVRIGIVPSRISVPEESSWVRTLQRKQ